MKKQSKKLFGIVLITSLILSTTACGKEENIIQNQSISETPISTGASEVDITVAPSKECYDDFFMQVNEDWFNNNSLSEWLVSYCKTDEYNEIMANRLIELVTLHDASYFAEDDPIHKLVLYYNQLEDGSQRNDFAMTRIKEMLNYVENVKNIDAFIKLMSDDTYSLFNNICSVSYDLNADGENVPFYAPVPLFEIYNQLSEKEYEILTSGYAKALENIGYSGEEAEKIAENAISMNKLIISFYNDISGNVKGYNENMWERVECKVDLMKMTCDLGFVMSDKWDTYPVLFILEGYIDWLNNILSEENLELLKDYYMISVLEKLSGCGNKTLISSIKDIGLRLGGAEIRLEGDDTEVAYSLSQLLSVDEGALAAYYASIYISDKQKEMIDDLTAKIIDSYVDVIKSIDWIDMQQRERINIKLKITKFFIGCIEEYNHLEDVEIKENVVDTTIEILKSNRKFNQGRLYVGKRLVPGTFDMYYPNAVYYSDENAVLITNGYFVDESLWDEASFEERLGTIGRVIAHELGHEFDSRNIGLKNNGVYDTNWDNYWEPYYNSFTPVFEYFDSIETLSGNKVSGNMVCNESYADLVALKILMGVLEKAENADYDAFFKAYAKDQAELLQPEYELHLLTHGTHTTPRERVNGCLAQEDKFYEIYDISTDSYFYIKPEDRIKILEAGN
ncbi:MAG: hypothetical protein MJ107_00825 [Lachnospiraceae bacterium]|nr:hypothetical protein [Lachnospiraceae bacterium]